MELYPTLFKLGKDGYLYYQSTEISTDPLNITPAMGESKVVVSEIAGISSSSALFLHLLYPHGSLVIYNGVVLSDKYCVEFWEYYIEVCTNNGNAYDKVAIMTRYNRIKTIAEIQKS